MVDMIWIGRLGSESVAAIGTANFYVTLSLGISSLVIIGSGVKVAQSIGAKRNRDADEYIKNGMKFPATKNGQYASRIWDKFEKDVIGQYGFSAYFELDAIKPYDASKDPAASVSAKADVTATNAKF